MGTRMLQRRGTAAEWTAANPVLGDGEIGYDRTTGIIKIGDGVTAWSSLPTSKTFRSQALEDAAYSPIGAIPASLVDAAGDLLVGSADNTIVRLGKGANGQYLSVVAGALAWANLPAAANPFSVVTAAEDLIVGSGNGTVKRVGVGTAGQVLTVVGGVLTWTTPSSGTTDSTKVLKTGDTMSGKLTIDIGNTLATASGSTAEAAVFGGQDTNGDALLIRLKRTSTGSSWANTDLELLRRVDATEMGGLALRSDGAHSIGNLWEGSNRVYSAANPPPASGMSILAASNALTQINTSWASITTFVAPSSGRVRVNLTGNSTGGQYTNISLNGGSTYQQVLLPNAETFVSYTGLTPGATYTLYFQSATGGVISVVAYSVEG